jgi:hypothetical protein
MPLNVFYGILNVDHGESYLIQVTASGCTIQTPMMLIDYPITGADSAQLIAEATSYFLNQKHVKSGEPITVHGTVISLGSTPFIEVLRES